MRIRPMSMLPVRNRILVGNIHAYKYINYIVEIPVVNTSKFYLFILFVTILQFSFFKLIYTIII